MLRQQQRLTTLPVLAYHAEHPSIPLHSYHSIVNTLALLHHTALASPTTLATTLQTETPLTLPATATLVTAYTTTTHQTEAQHSSSHTPFAYLDTQWKVGVTLADSTTTSAGAAYVVLCVSAVDESGSGVSEQCVELSVKEFRAFHKRMADIAAQMDSM